jgi:hypothetical protein
MKALARIMRRAGRVGWLWPARGSSRDVTILEPDPSGTLRAHCQEDFMTDHHQAARDLAGELLGRPLELPLGQGEPASGAEFRELAHTLASAGKRIPIVAVRAFISRSLSPGPARQQSAPVRPPRPLKLAQELLVEPIGDR